MTQQQHPITPPPELVQQWRNEGYILHSPVAISTYVATRAAQWGANQELEACCEWIHGETSDEGFIANLRAARRPKPPSLKEQALKELAWIDEHLDMPLHNHCDAVHTIRRALESIPTPCSNLL